MKKMNLSYLLGLTLAQDHCSDQLDSLPRKRFENDVLSSLEEPVCPDKESKIFSEFVVKLSLFEKLSK